MRWLRWWPRKSKSERQLVPAIVAVWNETRQTSLGGSIAVASTAAQRRKGLLSRASLTSGEGLWIVPCEAIHTFGMQFPIDLVYVDRQKRVRKVRSQVVSGRVSGCLIAHSVLELPAGTVSESSTRPGDWLLILPVPGN